MKRIGIAASKMAKGNLVLYNSYVVLISFLFSLFIFIVAGCTVVFALIAFAYVSNELIATEFEKGWLGIFAVCMITLTVVMFLFNLIAISTNMKLPSKKE